MNEVDSHDKARQLINSGAELAAGAAGGALGFLAAGPAGAAALGAAGMVTSKLLSRLGQEFSDRILGPREKQRVGGVLAIAASDIQARLQCGENLRADGFFEKDSTDRSDAEEVAESTILKVQRDPEEKKLRYMGYFFSNVAFDDNISPQMAHQIIKACERMTYRQFCILNIFGVEPIRSSLRESDYRNQSEFVAQKRQVLYECFDLARSYYIVDESYIMGVTDLRPQHIYTHGIGADIFNCMRLKELPVDDPVPVIEQLR